MNPDMKLCCGLFGVLLFAHFVAWAQAELSSLSNGNSLSVERETDFLISPNGSFSSGFYKVGTNAYCYSIWFTKSRNKTVVWMANRDKPVNGKYSKLSLLKHGNLVLIDSDDSIIWSTNTFSAENVEARLLESGNLVLINQAEEIIWESFNFPTDTLLPTQPLIKNTTLVSLRARGTYFSGYYNLRFDDNNVLNLIFDSPLVSSVYWPTTDVPVFNYGRTPYNSTRVARFNDVGRFKSSDNLKFNASDYGDGVKRRLTLDYDGILRLYSLDDSTGLWIVSWLRFGLSPCRVHGLCGDNGICSFEPLPTCSCPLGFVRNDDSDWSKGCSPQFNLSCDPVDSDFIAMPGKDYYGYDLTTYGLQVSFESCKNACLNDCKCKGFGYSMEGKGECFPKRYMLNGYPNPSRVMHVKVPKEMKISEAQKVNKLNCSNSEILIHSETITENPPNKNRYMKYLLAFVGSFGIVETICIGLCWWLVFQRHGREELANMGYIALAMGFKRFTFSELKKATQNFKHEIGKGGFGKVYKGVLENERVVAVKRLEGVLQGDSEFWAEVSIIGKLNHKNLIKLWGFCAEGHHKLLVYEYMNNGSLDKILFTDSSRKLGLDQRFKIALGTAKCLKYIHEECLEWVLHCDVKPQNILLDDNLEPKVTDFGMSKFFKETQDSGFSRVRGTRGYLAPEWMMNLRIDAKVDVYSYGIVLLELLTGKSSCNLLFSTEGEIEYNQLAQWVGKKIEQGRVMEVIDPRMDIEYNDEKLERLVRVALLCVGEDRETRPAMSKVVEILNGFNESQTDEEISD